MIYVIGYHVRISTRTFLQALRLSFERQWTQDVVGHPGQDSWLWAFKNMFHTRVPDTELTQKIEDTHRTCKECVTSKQTGPSDRG